MKNLLNSLLLFLAITMLGASCKKSELTKYEQPDMVYVYKDAFNTKKDSSSYSFAIKANSLMLDTVYIPVRIMGLAADKAREVKLAPVNDLTTATDGIHYALLPYTIPAGAYSANLPVLVKRTADLKTKEFRLVLEIAETKDFKPGVPNTIAGSSVAGAGLRYLIKLNDFLTKPANWDASLTSFFGTYSQAKHKFIIQVTGLAEYPYGCATCIAYGEMLYYKALCKSKLLEYEAANGPLIDEFGVRVTFP